MRLSNFLFASIAYSALVLTSACSTEGRLEGRWQSTKPDSSFVLSIASTSAPDGDGYRDGLTVTISGKTYASQYWRVADNRLDVSIGRGSEIQMLRLAGLPLNAISHQIVELTRDRLVLKWSDGGGGTGNLYEFRRLGSEVTAASSSSDNERNPQQIAVRQHEPDSRRGLPFPSQTGLLNDFAHIVPSGSKLGEQLSQLERSHTFPVVVVTITDLGGVEPDEAVSTIRNVWHLEEAGPRSPLLVLLVPKDSLAGRKGQIRIGTTDASASLTSSAIDSIIKGLMPDLRAKEYGRALERLVSVLDTRFAGTR